MIQSVTLVILSLAAILLGAAALLAVAKIVRGPSALDRVVAADLVVAIAICGIGLWAELAGDPQFLVVLLVLSLVGFTGATAVARLVGDKAAPRHVRREDGR